MKGLRPAIIDLLTNGLWYQFAICFNCFSLRLKFCFSGIPFDREIKDKYELVVEVRSEAGRGVNPRVAHVIVDIDVLDMNDNAPIFVNLPYFAIVQRSKSKKDSSVIKVCK